MEVPEEKQAEVDGKRLPEHKVVDMDSELKKQLQEFVNSDMRLQDDIIDTILVPMQESEKEKTWEFQRRKQS